MLLDTVFFVVPFVAGWVASSAAESWSLANVHDSVLRHSQRNKNWDPESMRSTFCAIVNGKKALINVDGSDWPTWKARMGRRTALLLGTMTITIIVGFVQGSLSEGSKLEWTLASPIIPLATLLHFKAKLHRTPHRTSLTFREDNRWKTIRLQGERADDGVPTRNAGVVP